MDTYIQNRYCPCARCRMNYMMGPAMLVTVGVLGLLASWRLAAWHSTWPIILIVLGAVKVLQSSLSTDGHRQPGVIPPGHIPPVPPPPAAPPATESSEVSHG